MGSKRVRRIKVLAVTAVTLGAVSMPFLGVMNLNVAGASTTTTGFYLVLGGSASIGVQPTLAVPKGQPTDRGYANGLVAYEAARGVTLSMTQLGCPGEKTGTMINGHDHCYRLRHTQLAEAMSFLLSHKSDLGIVTIDLGFNNLLSCFKNQAVASSCVTNQLSLIKQDMPTIIAALQSTAGPGVTFVGVGHYDPYLAAAANGTLGQAYALATNKVITRLNFTLESLYASAGIALAPVSSEFENHDLQRVKVSGGATLPDNVAHACALTWMCKAPPYGPNMHPNDAGYAAIALAIESVLKAPWSSVASLTALGAG